MSKVELNDVYVNKIIHNQSDDFSNEWSEEVEKDIWELVIKSKEGKYYSGKVKQLEDATYAIIEDTEFEEVYPVLDKKTGKIVKIKHSENYPPGTNEKS